VKETFCPNERFHSRPTRPVVFSADTNQNVTSLWVWKQVSKLKSVVARQAPSCGHNIRILDGAAA
jgi:hypothetical protein